MESALCVALRSGSGATELQLYDWRGGKRIERRGSEWAQWAEWGRRARRYYQRGEQRGERERERREQRDGRGRGRGSGRGARAQRDGDGGRAPGGGRAHPRADPLRDHAHAAAACTRRTTRAPHTRRTHGTTAVRDTRTHAPRIRTLAHTT